MPEINFIELCESVLEETFSKERLALLEEEVQQQTPFQQRVTEIANKINEILGEVEDARFRRNPYGSLEARKPDLFKLRKKLKDYLNQGRREAIAALRKPDQPFVPYTEDEVDNFIHKKVTEGGIFDSFGKILSNQFGEEYFQTKK